MTQKNNGGPAFPSEGEGHGDPRYHTPGMHLRDWFAGQALAGLASACNSDGMWMGTHAEYTANAAYAIADAMLTERENGK